MDHEHHSRPPTRELAERTSNGTLVRLLWTQGTTLLWIEVHEPDTDRAFRILVKPEQALDAFHHPYAHAGTHGSVPRAESLDPCERWPQAAGEKCHEH
jgi:hypothetical protein